VQCHGACVWVRDWGVRGGRWGVEGGGGRGNLNSKKIWEK
jgi:hypothetical protein